MPDWDEGGARAVQDDVTDAAIREHRQRLGHGDQWPAPDFGASDWERGEPTFEEKVEQVRAALERHVDLVALGAVWSKRLNDPDTWTDRRGTAHAIATMDPDHRMNVLGMLRRYSARLQHVVELYELSTMPETDTAWLDEAPLTPLEWMREQPCFKALVNASL
jgi:hypothetical protein